MRFKTFITTAAFAGMLLIGATQSATAGVVPLKPISSHAGRFSEPSYNLAYDSFVLGALPIWVTRDYDDGPKRLTISIRFEGSSYTSYEYIDIYGTEAQATFNQYAGPGFVEVNIVEINPI
ncbi:hypothetical protein C7T94_04360 [Pedobacter yulinensis]|uniref:Uncharacterized protein n=1 Tax=Pedobacter yulinensis TaxID=2126353 RepID=A0A2T3HNJ0_9SPHI|nr:hypothetical protein [Pedobacter yulinensis]PST83977.1 hypothetical protein C7T94_04360 [Pedobacter yulinensis]